MKKMKRILFIFIFTLGSFESSAKFQKDVKHSNDAEKNPIVFSKEKMGFMTWSLMHFYSGFAPETPNETEQSELKELIRLLSVKKGKILRVSGMFK